MKLLCEIIAALCAMTALTLIWPGPEVVRAPWWMAVPLLLIALLFLAAGEVFDRRRGDD